MTLPATVYESVMPSRLLGRVDALEQLLHELGRDEEAAVGADGLAHAGRGLGDEGEPIVGPFAGLAGVVHGEGELAEVLEAGARIVVSANRPAPRTAVGPASVCLRKPALQRALDGVIEPALHGPRDRRRQHVVIDRLRPALANQLVGVRIGDVDALADRFAEKFFGELHEHGRIS